MRNKFVENIENCFSQNINLRINAIFTETFFPVVVFTIRTVSAQYYTEQFFYYGKG